MRSFFSSSRVLILKSLLGGGDGGLLGADDVFLLWETNLTAVLERGCWELGDSSKCYRKATISLMYKFISYPGRNPVAHKDPGLYYHKLCKVLQAF